jgi:hypothetical protein
VFRFNITDRAASRHPVAQPVTCAPHAVPLLHKRLHVHLMSPPVAQPVTRAPHAAPLLHKWLHVHLIPSPSCTTSYRCTSCRPQLHNQLQVHLIPSPTCTISYKCTSCCTTDIPKMIACKAKKFFGTIYIIVPPIVIMELSLWSVILNRQNWWKEFLIWYCSNLSHKCDKFQRPIFWVRANSSVINTGRIINHYLASRILM